MCCFPLSLRFWRLVGLDVVQRSVVFCCHEIQLLECWKLLWTASTAWQLQPGVVFSVPWKQGIRWFSAFFFSFQSRVRWVSSYFPFLCMCTNMLQPLCTGKLWGVDCSAHSYGWQISFVPECSCYFTPVIQLANTLLMSGVYWLQCSQCNEANLQVYFSSDNLEISLCTAGSSFGRCLGSRVSNSSTSSSWTFQLIFGLLNLSSSPWQRRSLSRNPNLADFQSYLKM